LSEGKEVLKSTVEMYNNYCKADLRKLIL